MCIEFRFTEAQNDWLMTNRRVSFEDVIEAVTDGRAMDERIIEEFENTAEERLKPASRNVRAALTSPAMETFDHITATEQVNRRRCPPGGSGRLRWDRVVS